MRARLADARGRLEALAAVADPDEAQRGSIGHWRERIAHLERMTTPER
jgi:hypothetical protein